MNTSEAIHPVGSVELRGILDDAIRYWELRRIPYNFILAAVTIAWGAADWTHLRQTPVWAILLTLFVLAALANVLYCSAYLVDIFIQSSSFRDLWRRRRWILWLAGTLLAVALANAWIIAQISQ
ncbi:MAG TPA: hypothetical protein VGR81_03065 [Candidatus Acidoferrales bacterium]|nr:hypothetical protein [Candidatus Acidoferrales bacterium]